MLLEFQSTVDYRMPLRLLFYINEILREYVVNAKHKRYDKNIKIPAIVPVVLYNGEEVWDVPTEFRKMIYNEELFGDNILNFKYDIFDISNDKQFKKEKLLENKTITSIIFLLDQKLNPQEFLERIKEIALFFNSLSDTERKAIKNWLKNTLSDDVAETAIEILESNREEVEKMVARNAFMIEEMKEEAKIEGIEEGFEKGKKEEKIKIAKNLLDILDDKTIAAKTGLDIEVVLRLRRKEE
nr:Rpn family recombination-promoting nuclease/putative transposase [uncultured Clostridium sp.]